MTRSFLCLFLCSFVHSISAATGSNWNKPCFSGVCEYNLPSPEGGSSGTLTIWGPSTAIGDITPAAGWAILTCSPEALKQTIRIACLDGGSSDCARLFGNANNLNDGVGKVVRLPVTCGKNAFAIITKATLAEDQSIPASMMPSLMRRDGTLPTVHALHIDTSMEGAESLPVEQQVRFAINIPGAAATPTNYISRSHANIKGRGLSSAVSHGIAEIKSVNKFEERKSLTMPPVDVNQNFTIIDEATPCPSSRAGVAIHVNTKSHAAMTVGVAATGTLVPPNIDSISLTGSISANIDAIVDMTSKVGGTWDLENIKLFEVGLPGLDIPGILSIGPWFEIAAKATAGLDTELDMKIGIKYNIDQASFTFPQQSGAGGGLFTQGNTPLKVNITPRVVGATGTVSVHLIPSLNFGISAFDGKKKANVFVNVDASVSATQGVTARETKQISRDEHIPAIRIARKGSLPIPDHPADHNTKRSDSLSSSPLVLCPQPENKLSVLARADDVPPVSVDGCFEADTSLSVNVGADADFFNVFRATTQVPLFNKNFQLFKKCFGSSSPKRSLSPPLIRREPELNREIPKKRSLNLQCLPLSPQIPLPIVDAIIPGATI